MADQTCRICGCTQAQACPSGCAWAEPDLCTACQAITAPGHEIDLFDAFADAAIGSRHGDPRIAGYWRHRHDALLNYLVARLSQGEEIKRLKDALRQCARNDPGISYEYGQPRRFDGRKPKSGTRWLLPREIARRALSEPNLATLGDIDDIGAE